MYTHQKKIKDETKYLRDNVQIISEAIAKLHGKVDSIIDSISHMKMTNDVKRGKERAKNEEIERKIQRDYRKAGRERKRRKIVADQAQKEIVEKLASIRKGTLLMDSNEHLAGLLFIVMKESEISLTNENTTLECIHLWKSVVLEGTNVLEEFTNYNTLTVSVAFRHLIFENNALASSNMVNGILKRAEERTQKARVEKK
nr:hypothetical protein Itr_chr13CG17810 [Ipomoea trifida]